MTNRKMKQVKIIWLIVVLGTLPSFAGCGSQMYRSNLQDNPQCVRQAQISQVNINACMDSHGRADFNACLASRGVPQYKITSLNACLNTHRSPIGSLFY